MKLKIKSILVPLDFSKNAQAGKEMADFLAAQFGAKVELLHVVETAPFAAYVERGDVGGEPIEDPLGEAVPGARTRVIIKDLVKDAQKQLDGMKKGKKAAYRTVVRQGHAVDEILKEIAERKPDLLVLCTHGWSGLKHLMLGSVAEKVVRLSPVPVLTVKT